MKTFHSGQPVWVCLWTLGATVWVQGCYQRLFPADSVFCPRVERSNPKQVGNFADYEIRTEEEEHAALTLTT